jgi:hypothetical protein
VSFCVLRDSLTWRADADGDAVHGGGARSSNGEPLVCFAGGFGAFEATTVAPMEGSSGANLRE